MSFHLNQHPYSLDPSRQTASTHSVRYNLCSYLCRSGISMLKSILWWSLASYGQRNRLLAFTRHSKDTHRQQASFLHNLSLGLPFPSLPCFQNRTISHLTSLYPSRGTPSFAELTHSSPCACHSLRHRFPRDPEYSCR